MIVSPQKRSSEEFLSNLKIISGQKGFALDLKLIKRYLQLYRFQDKSRPYFLFIHGSLNSFWEISANWEEITHLIPSDETNWAVIFLQKASGENSPLGFLISSDDFLKMKSGLGINRMGRIKIHKKDLAVENQFDSWDSFFQLLNLTFDPIPAFHWNA